MRHFWGKTGNMRAFLRYYVPHHTLGPVINQRLLKNLEFPLNLANDPLVTSHVKRGTVYLWKP